MLRNPTQTGVPEKNCIHDAEINRRRDEDRSPRNGEIDDLEQG